MSETFPHHDNGPNILHHVSAKQYVYGRMDPHDAASRRGWRRAVHRTIHLQKFQNVIQPCLTDGISPRETDARRYLSAVFRYLYNFRCNIFF